MTWNRQIPKLRDLPTVLVRRSLLAAGVAWMLLSPGPAIAAGSADDTPAQHGMEIAIAPFLPARTLVKNYQPMRAYLEKVLQEPVSIITAPDYLTYYERFARREYPVIIAVANFSWLAHSEAGYVPMLRPAVLTRPVLVVAKDSRHTRLADLRDRVIALPDPLAIVSAQAREMLRERGIDPDRDVRLRHLPTHSAAIHHLLAGEVEAAIVSDRALQQMETEPRERVRELDSWKPGAAPGVFYMASPALPRERTELIARALLAFAGETREGRALMQQTGYGSLVRAGNEDLTPLAPYGKWLKAEIVKARERRQPPKAAAR